MAAERAVAVERSRPNDDSSGPSLRVASWNLNGRTGATATALGELLASRGGADIVLLQESAASGIEAFRKAAGLDWHEQMDDRYQELLQARDRNGARCVALASRGSPPTSVTALPDLPLPEKVLAGWVRVGNTPVAAISYHAPAGVQHQEKKAEQAVRLARWLESLEGPGLRR